MSGFIQKRSVYPGTSLAYTSNVTAGNLLVVWLVWHTGTLTGVTGSLNGAFTLSSTFGTGVTFCAFAYKFNCVGGAETISTAGTATDMGFSIYEFSGIQTSSDPLDGAFHSYSSATFGSSTTPITGSFSTSAQGLILAGIGDEGTAQTGATAAGTGYTLGNDQIAHFHADEYALSKPAGNYTASFTLSIPEDPGATGDCIIVIACFKDAGAVAGGGWVGSGSRRAPGQRGPFDRRGFLMKWKFDYTPSAAPIVTVLQRKTLGTTGNHTGGRQRRGQ